MSEITPDVVRQYKEFTPKFLCGLEANIYNIQFKRFRIRYMESDFVLFDVGDDSDNSNQDEEIYLIFGKESTGIPRDILSQDLEHCMRIPMTSNVRSLNLSNCCAIVLYEVLRQQDYRDLLRKEPHKSENFIIDGIDHQ